MSLLKRFYVFVALSFVFFAADKSREPAMQETFKIPPFEDLTFHFTPLAKGKVEAFVQLDQRECFINIVIKAPSGRVKNSKRIGYTQFRATADITSDELNQPWSVRIKNHCDMKPVSGVLKLYYPAAAESSPPAPPTGASVPTPPPDLPPSSARADAEKLTNPSVAELRLNGKNRSSSMEPILKDAALSFVGVTLSSDPADLDRENQGWVFLGTPESAAATLTLTFASEGWIAVFADFTSSAPVGVRVSSSVVPETSSALVLSPQSEWVRGEATLPIWVKGSPGTIVKITYSSAGIWVRGVRIQNAVPPDAPRA